MKFFSKSFIMLSFILFFVFPTKASASSDYQKIVINGETFYVETVVTESIYENQNSINGITQTKTATKTQSYLDANHNVLWSVSITATFIYDDVTSQCVYCSHSASSYASSWSIKSSSSSYSGNSATATATATHTDYLWISHDYTMSVTIYCSPTGVIS